MGQNQLRCQQALGKKAGINLIKDNYYLWSMPKYGGKIETVRLAATVPKEMEARLLKDLYTTMYKLHPYYKRILAYMRRHQNIPLKTLSNNLRQDLEVRPDTTTLQHIAEIFGLEFEE